MKGITTRLYFWVLLGIVVGGTLGYVNPPLGVALKLAMKAMVMPLLGAPAVNEAFRFLAGNRALLPAA